MLTKKRVDAEEEASSDSSDDEEENKVNSYYYYFWGMDKVGTGIYRYLLITLF